jgi:CBS domain-containing protein
MAIFLGANGGEILSSRSVSDLVAGVKGKLAEKMAYLLPAEAEELLRNLTERLGEELAFEVEFCSRVAESLAELGRLQYVDQLSLLFERFKLMTEDHFARRGSVVAFHALTAAFHDVLIRKAVELSEADMELDLKTRPPVPYCFLAAGTAGRMELTFGDGDEYFLVREDPQGEYAAYFEEFLYRVIAILELSGLRSVDRRLVTGAGLWHGTGDEWRSWARVQRHQGKEGLDTKLASLADLREICGDATLVAGLKGFARSVLIDEQQTDAFVQGVKKLSSLPVALGIFGGFRIERSGEHRGEFNLEEFALAPLIMNVRVLAIGSGLAETSTVDRVKGLVTAGNLGVDLAERLLKAFHVFARQKIISSSAGVMEGVFIKPEKLSEEEEQLFKYGLEAVVNVQRIVYQTFAEQG